MINNHFELQNIIRDVERSPQSRDQNDTTDVSDANDDSSFEATMARVSNNPTEQSTDNESDTDAAEESKSTSELETSENEEEAKLNKNIGVSLTDKDNIDSAEGKESGIILPLIQSKKFTLDQLTLGGKRSVLIARSANVSDVEGQLKSSKGSLDTLGIGKAREAISKSSNDNPTLLQKDSLLKVLGLKGGQNLELTLPKTENTQLDSIGQELELRISTQSGKSSESIPIAESHIDINSVKEKINSLIKQQIINSFSGKNVSVKMLLTPESLGEVEVDLLFSRGSDVHVTLRSENSEVVKLMQVNATALRDQLASEAKGQFSLQVSGIQDQNAGFHDRSGYSKNQDKNLNNTGTDENEIADKTTVTDGTNSRRQVSMIDTYA
ncbi:flagellar hook-length control protein FliK [Gammaproteobacteria bacterium]|nr:flagellar hook-length control protein FliK [Gammaproteobacteria bacterium]MDB2376130.1 flagellar hook-length control protein FliK [Gammaproteobacteria bacterium]